MEIKLNAGDKITIPTGCKATIEDNLIIIEEKQEEFKEGEILSAIDSTIILVFKGYHKNINVFCSYCNNTGWGNEGWNASKFRHATEEEKQTFFDELKAKGLRWNAETKQMEKVRERLQNFEKYLTIDEFGEVNVMAEDCCKFDDKKFDLGNYYIPEEREQAEEDAKAIRAIFEKRLKV